MSAGSHDPDAGAPVPDLRGLLAVPPEGEHVLAGGHGGDLAADTEYYLARTRALLRTSTVSMTVKRNCGRPGARELSP